jgi:ferrous iron transport protein A
MKGEGRATTLADVRVGASAVLIAGPTLDARQARRLVELGLRPGATVRVMMRTAGGGRVLGVDNLRIVLDHSTLRAIPVTLHRPTPPAPVAVTDEAATTEAGPAVPPGPASRASAGRLRLLGHTPGTD